MDVADYAQVDEALFFAGAMFTFLKKQQADEALCTHCEEFPPHVESCGTRFRYCDRCLGELSEDQGRTRKQAHTT